MRFPDICLVEQTEQKFRRIRVCFKEKQAGPAQVDATSKAQE